MQRGQNRQWHANVKRLAKSDKKEVTEYREWDLPVAKQVKEFHAMKSCPIPRLLPYASPRAHRKCVEISSRQPFGRQGEGNPLMTLEKGIAVTKNMYTIAMHRDVVDNHSVATRNSMAPQMAGAHTSTKDVAKSCTICCHRNKASANRRGTWNAQ